MHEKKFIHINNESIAYFEYKTGQNLLKRIVLFCHGFPGGNRLETLAQPLKEHGITLVEANYRGDQECEGKFSFFGSADDIRALTGHIRAEYPGIPVTALAFSAGGFFACCLARQYPDLFDKIVLLNPLLDMSFTKTKIMGRLWQEARECLQLHEAEFYEAELEKILKQSNPIDFAPELTPKINLVVSSNDEILPPANAQRFYDQLKNPGELKWIPGAGHSVAGNEPEIINLLLD